MLTVDEKRATCLFAGRWRAKSTDELPYKRETTLSAYVSSTAMAGGAFAGIDSVEPSAVRTAAVTDARAAGRS